MIRRVQVVHVANGATRVVTHSAPAVSVQVGNPHDKRQTYLALFDADGEQVGAAWYLDTVRVLADAAIPTTEGAAP